MREFMPRRRSKAIVKGARMRCPECRQELVLYRVTQDASGADCSVCKLHLEIVETDNQSGTYSVTVAHVVEDESVPTLLCYECGEAMFVTPNGIAHHLLKGSLDRIDHVAD